jgi:hypothetical protein
LWALWSPMSPQCPTRHSRTPYASRRRANLSAERCFSFQSGTVRLSKQRGWASPEPRPATVSAPSRATSASRSASAGRSAAPQRGGAAHRSVRQGHPGARRRAHRCVTIHDERLPEDTRAIVRIGADGRALSSRSRPRRPSARRSPAASATSSRPRSTRRPTSSRSSPSPSAGRRMQAKSTIARSRWGCSRTMWRLRKREYESASA